MNFALSNHTIDKYFGFLLKLDKESKLKLIERLTASINRKDHRKRDIWSLYGAWDDERTSDEIIREIREARKEKNDSIGF